MTAGTVPALALLCTCGCLGGIGIGLPLKPDDIELWCTFEPLFGDPDDVSRLPVDCVECEKRVDGVERVWVDREGVDVECGVECVTGDLCDADDALPRVGTRNPNGYLDTTGCPRLDMDADVRLSEGPSLSSTSSSSSSPSSSSPVSVVGSSLSSSRAGEGGNGTLSSEET